MTGINKKANVKILLDSIVKLCRRNAVANVLKIIKKTHDSDLAYILTELKRDERVYFTDLLYRERRLGAVLLELEQPDTRAMLELLTIEELVGVCSTVSIDEAVDLIGYLPADKQQQVLDNSPPTIKRHLANLLKYDRDSAGGLMTLDYLALPEGTLVADAIDRVQKALKPIELFYLYVIDTNELLKGVLSLRTLLTVPGDSTLDEIMKREVYKVGPETPKEEVAKTVAKYDLLALPVVDDNNKLIGIITVDDVIDVIRDLETAEYLKMAGANVQELTHGNRALRIASLRLPWLVVNFCGGLLTGFILFLFDHTLSEVMALVSFVPIIAGMGGNVGTQSSSITIRGLATGSLDASKLSAMLFKELRVGLLMGLICGSIVGLVGFLWQGKIVLGLVVGLAMCLAMTVAAIMGVMVPIAFQKFGVDPALASAPFVSTSNDITGVIIYLSLATTLLSYLT